MNSLQSSSLQRDAGVLLERENILQVATARIKVIFFATRKLTLP